MADRVEFKLTGLDGVLDMLKKMPAEAVSKKGGPVKTALRKGARVILLEERKNLQAVISNATAKGVQESTGLLMKNLVVTRGKAPTGGNGERYLVRVKRKTYEGTGAGGKGKAVTTLKTAQLLEYGSGNQPAEPWIRPAFKAKAREAILVTERELVKEIDKIARKLIKQGKR